MTETDFVIFTGIAGVALGFALLWVMTQFLKTDSETAAMEKEMKKSIEEIENVTGEPEQGAVEGEAASMILPGADPAQDEELAEREASIAKLLFGWGTFAWLVGMIGGGLFFGLVGAFLGAIVASVAGALGVTTTVLVRDRLAARHAALEAERAAQLAANPEVEEELDEAGAPERATQRV